MAATHPVVDPRTGEIIEYVELLSPACVPEVARRALAAFRPWADMPLERRCRLIADFAATLAAKAPTLARAYSREHGKTVAEAKAELARAVDTIQWATVAAEGVTRSAMLPAREGLTRLISVEPVGPVLAIVPWNFPAVVLARKLGPALAIGHRLNAGSVSVNSAPGAAPGAPLGGRGASGYGYEGGEQGMLAFTRLKICQHSTQAALA